MSSSRWRRFAFFDRCNISLPDSVIQDIIPYNTAISITNTAGSISLSPLKQLFSDEEVTYASHAEYFSMTVTTASSSVETEVTAEEASSRLFPPSVNVSSLVCTPAITASSSGLQNKVVYSSKRGACVLIFLSSRSSDKVYWVDVSSRCNPRQDDLEDVDGVENNEGYQGYMQPFSHSSTSKEDKVIQEHTHNGYTDNRIVGLASCSTDLEGDVFLAAISDDVSSQGIIVYKNPHSSASSSFQHHSNFDFSHRGLPRAVTILPSYVGVGTDKGYVVLYHILQPNKLTIWMEIPPPPNTDDVAVTSVHLSCNEEEKMRLYVTYRKSNFSTVDGDAADTGSSRPMGVCSFDLGKKGSRSNTFLARFDLDGRNVPCRTLTDLDASGNLVLAKTDGLYFFTAKNRAGASPVDGEKIVVCCVDSSSRSSYALVASKDSKSSRDTVDIYDTDNKLVAFHVLLSPGHKALQAAGTNTNVPFSNRLGCASGTVFTSGGSLLILTEKSTSEKVSLLLQKNLYTAAIGIAYNDPSYSRDEISMLYRKHAEFLYRKGEYDAAMDEYIHTIGMGVVEPSHVIYRYLDSPKIPHLVKYLEALREKGLALEGHLNLLKACYYKLNDAEKAEKVGEESTDWKKGVDGFVLSQDPMEALKTVCSMDAPHAVEALRIHGASLARALPRETAGIIVSLCDGTYSPQNLASFASYMDSSSKQQPTLPASIHEKYPIEYFANAFLENPKLLRVLLSHCRNHRYEMSPSLRRTLLELTLEEWKDSRILGDVETEKKRASEALSILADSHARDIGDYEALVIVQLAGFTEGEVLLYERLQMAPMLLERYARDGTERARRQMLAMCRTDPELLAEVLGYFVALASDPMLVLESRNDGDSARSEGNMILEDIQEALDMAKAQGILSPVRIVRILAGEGVSQFSTDFDPSASGTASSTGNADGSVPLSVALDYVGGILDEASQKIGRLKNEIEEYNRSCSAMEVEINSLLAPPSATPSKPAEETKPSTTLFPSIDIEKMYDTLLEAQESKDELPRGPGGVAIEQEEFWREMEQSDDRFETIARFFGKGIIH